MVSHVTGSEKIRPARRIAQSSLCAFIVLSCGLQGVAQAETVAGKIIPNMATASYELGGAQTSTDSNVASLTIAERLDVAIAAMTPRVAIAPDASVTAVPFLVTNLGNGDEAFEIAANTDQTAASVQGYAVDRDGNGSYDANVDTLLTGNTLPAQAPGAQQRIFVLVGGAAAAGNVVTVSASARATTGSGDAGTTFGGRGDGGGDAVVGKTGAAANAQALLSPAAPPPTLAKTQSVSAPDGSARAMHGAIITYTLTAHFNGATPAATVADPIPDGTVYRAGSLHLDGGAVSDAADADAGSFDGSTVRVALGDVAAAGDHVITFQTTIQ
jgi:uncharacterized repeat protein (TIGR01451 family)